MLAKWLAMDPKGEKLRPTFREVAAEFLDHYEAKFKAGNLRESTIIKARRYIGKYLVEEFGYFYIDQITPREWEKFVTACQHRSPDMNLENHWKHMNYVMFYARKCKFVSDWEIKNPSPSQQIGRVITSEEKKAIFSAATPTLRDQMLFASTKGMRLREHLQLSWDTSYCCHVNMEARTVIVCSNHSKTLKARTMKMSEDVLQMLSHRSKFEYWHRGYLKRQVPVSPWVFPNIRDRSKPAYDNKTAWRSALKAAKIKGRLRYDDWRHTWLTEAAKKVRLGQASIALVCAYAGLSIQIFQKNYLHLNE